MADKVHATLSPSSADRWMACPGSVYLSEDKPDTASVYSADGSLAHEVAEMVLNTGRPAADFIGHRAFDRVCSAEMAKHVQHYADAVREYLAHPSDSLFVEVELGISNITGEANAVGTADSIILSHAKQEITVIDLKFGRGHKVVAENNRQLQIYGLAALEKYDLIGDWQTIQLVIDQPRAGGVSEWTIGVDELRAFGKAVSIAATKALDLLAHPDQAVLNLSPSDSACIWCRAKADCPALRAEIQNEFYDLDAAPIDERQNTGELLGRVDLIDGWSDDNAVTSLFKSMRLKHSEMYDYRLIAPSTAQRLLAKDHPRQWEKLQQYVTKKEGSTDPRPAMVGNSSTNV